MKRRFFLLLFPLLALLLTPPLFAQSPVWKQKIAPKLSEALNKSAEAPFLVVLEAQADLSPARRIRNKTEKGRYVYQTLSALAEQTQEPVRRTLRTAGAYYNAFWIINALSSYGSRSLVEQLAQMPEVARIEPDPVWRMHLVPGNFTNNGAEDRTLTAVAWGLTKINADDVWNLGYTGAGVVVGGQDTGYEWEHPALKPKYRGWNGTSVNHNYNWHDAIHSLINGGTNSCGLNLSAPCDDHSHGTHTMGTMIGATNNNNVIGVAPDAQWIGCRNMEEGDGQPSTYIECFEWFLAPTDISGQNPDPSKAPDVINNSWGCPIAEGCNSGNFSVMEAVVNSVRAAGIVVVVSAGNDGPNCSTVAEPAPIYTSSFTVGATDINDAIANFSNRGPVTVYGNGYIVKPDISAPGVGVYSSVGVNNSSGTYTYASYNGTSMAGPHVAGLVALMISAKPVLRGQVDMIETLIKNTAVPRYASSPFCGLDNANTRPNNVYGYGRIDALAAVVSALPISLAQFSAKAEGSAAKLHWITLEELDCARFDIQRSCDGLRWQTIGQMPCKGDVGDEATEYFFSDENPCKGLNYYRLQQNDFSGQTSFSPSVALSFAPTGYSLRMLGQAGADEVYVEITGTDADTENWSLALFSTDGRQLMTAPLNGSGMMAVPELPGGVYTAVLYDRNGRRMAVAPWVH